MAPTVLWFLAFAIAVAVGHVIAIELPALIGAWTFIFNCIGIPLLAEFVTCRLVPSNFHPFRRWFALKCGMLAAAEIVRYFAYTRPFVSTTSDEILVAQFVWVMQMWTIAAVEGFARLAMRKNAHSKLTSGTNDPPKPPGTL